MWLTKLCSIGIGLAVHNCRVWMNEIQLLRYYYNIMAASM